MADGSYQQVFKRCNPPVLRNMAWKGQSFDLIDSRYIQLIFTADDILGADKTIRLWHADSGRHERTYTGHKEGISDLAWSFDSEMVASASDDKSIRLWSMVAVGCFALKHIHLYS